MPFTSISAGWIFTLMGLLDDGRPLNQGKSLKKHDFVLTPGRYVGAADQEEDSEPFAEKMARLTAQLKAQFEESGRLEGKIRKNLAGLGYGI